MEYIRVITHRSTPLILTSPSRDIQVGGSLLLRPKIFGAHLEFVTVSSPSGSIEIGEGSGFCAKGQWHVNHVNAEEAPGPTMPPRPVPMVVAAPVPGHSGNRTFPTGPIMDLTIRGRIPPWFVRCGFTSTLSNSRVDVDQIDLLDVESRNCTNDDDAVAVFFVALAALHFLIFFDKCAKKCDDLRCLLQGSGASQNTTT